MTVGERIQEARKSAGMRQTDLAKKIGVAVVTIGQYERGRREPSLDTMQKIANALDVSISDLIGYGGHIITEKMLDEELERAFLYKLDEHLSNMAGAEKELFFRLSLAQAEEMAKYSKEHKKTPPAAPQEAPEGE